MAFAMYSKVVKNFLSVGLLRGGVPAMQLFNDSHCLSVPFLIEAHYMAVVKFRRQLNLWLSKIFAHF